MGPVPSQDKPLSLAALKANKARAKLVTKTVTIAKVPKPTPKPQITSSISRQPAARNVVANSTPRQSIVPRKSSTPASLPSRQTSKEPLERVRQNGHTRTKRSSPAVSTPRLTSSDDESEEEDPPRKRARTTRRDSLDEHRRIRDLASFSEEASGPLQMVHAADIANIEILDQSRTKYQDFFTALEVDETDCPTITLQYPSVSQAEKYQLVRPTDSSDFMPLEDIVSNMKIIAEYYLDTESARKVNCEEDGSGFVQLLNREAKLRGRVGAQSRFISVVEKFNSLLTEKRKDGTIAKKLDEMVRVDVQLAEHIIKSQVYARTVSPQVHLVRQYASFSDNVYGELLPKFLSRIFKETHLKSNQIFVDLGSGVGNCVLQAALEIGCDSWGCEFMENPNTLAQLQAKEFPARCRLWGIKPGKVHLIHGDFLKKQEIKEVLKRADVILVNNQAFTAELNDKLKYVFLDVKEGAQIVSLKPFRSPAHKIKVTNVNDPINVLEVEEKARYSGMVSWADDHGKWYHQRKDSRALEAFTKKLARSK
ncbi:hypothetical protein LTR84_009941 [Exophiala bonariae]|uniref:Histone-lysine N-methyltransferase, H3 lysine-79 specific n=1 Tax=Exophiala bonariae TaxID=1690606 RepID=A0AAV9NLB3_9EURO|nr:hypothetical protein LTR84_009941 [Exophiala bonariae]